MKHAGGTMVVCAVLVGCGGDAFTDADAITDGTTGDDGSAADARELVDVAADVAREHDASTTLHDATMLPDVDAGEVLVDANAPQEAGVDAPLCAPVSAHGSFMCHLLQCSDQASFFCENITDDFGDDAGKGYGFNCLPLPPECACEDAHSCACLLAHPTWEPARDAGYSSVSVTCAESDAGVLTIFPVYSL